MRGSATTHGRSLLTFLGGIAEFERDLIRARTSEGARAKARGVHMCRPSASSLASARKSCATSPRARRRRPTSRGSSMRAEVRFRGLLNVLGRAEASDHCRRQACLCCEFFRHDPSLLTHRHQRL
ncbi:recombinase family protein [Methylocystis silviterrae]|uniref:recombinase family protein n=1 Tax=Methylocystis silviterrae TaxID=2743612 RepID=UPI001AEEFD38|nr:recombinase family protein [Methylocystis silviterrae]